eukprot:1178678-Prorocentrum_minimum.AAC.5
MIQREMTLVLRAMVWCKGGVCQVALSLGQISKISPFPDFITLELSGLSEHSIPPKGEKGTSIRGSVSRCESTHHGVPPPGIAA